MRETVCDGGAGSADEVPPPEPEVIVSYDESVRLRSFLHSERGKAEAPPLRFAGGAAVLVRRRDLIGWLMRVYVAEADEDWIEAEVLSQWHVIPVESAACAPRPPKLPFVEPVVLENRYAAYRVRLEPNGAEAWVARDDDASVRKGGVSAEANRAAHRRQVFNTTASFSVAANRRAAAVAERLRWATMSIAEKSVSDADASLMRWDPGAQRMVMHSQEGRFVLYRGRTVHPLHRFRVVANVRDAASVRKAFPLDEAIDAALARPSARVGETDVQRALRGSVTVPGWLQDQLRAMSSVREGDALFKEGTAYVVLRRALSLRLVRECISGGNSGAHLDVVAELLDTMEDVKASFDGVAAGRSGTAKSRRATLHRMARLTLGAARGLRALKDGYTGCGHGMALEKARAEMHHVIVWFEHLADVPGLDVTGEEGGCTAREVETGVADADAAVAAAEEEVAAATAAVLAADAAAAAGMEEAEGGALPNEECEEEGDDGALPNEECAEEDASQALAGEAADADAGAGAETGAGAAANEEDPREPLSDLERLTHFYALNDPSVDAAEVVARNESIGIKYGEAAQVSELAKLYAKLVKSFGEEAMAEAEQAAFDARPCPPPPSRIEPLGDVTAYGTSVMISAEAAVAAARRDAARAESDALLEVVGRTRRKHAPRRSSPRAKGGKAAALPDLHAQFKNNVAAAIEAGGVPPPTPFWEEERALMRLHERGAWQHRVSELINAPVAEDARPSALRAALARDLCALFGRRGEAVVGAGAPSPLAAEPCDEHGHFALYAAHSAVWKIGALLDCGVDINGPCTTFGTTLAYYHRDNIPTLRALERMGLDEARPFNLSGTALSEYARRGRKVDLTRWLHEVDLMKRYAFGNDLSERRVRAMLAVKTLAALDPEGVESAFAEGDRRKQLELDAAVKLFIATQMDSKNKKLKRQGGADFKMRVKELGVKPQRMKDAIAKARRTRRASLKAPPPLGGSAKKAAGGSGLKAAREMRAVAPAGAPRQILVG